MKTIPLTQAQVALVDDDDYESLAKHKWYALRKPNGQFRAVRHLSQGGRQGKLLYMHREIVKPPAGLEVDHINGDGLDNRRANLRIVTRAANARNVHRRSPTRRGLPMGAWPHHGNNRFRAQIWVGGRRIHLGIFDTAGKAHAAYVAAKQESIEAALADVH